MKISTIGAGFVSEHLPYSKIKDRVELNINQINKILDKEKPDVLINCIGKTGRPNIDWCETHKEETALANTAIPILLAEVCDKRSIHFINIGSGCIFYSHSPNLLYPHWDRETYKLHTDLGWKETDFANPKSYYSKTKYACDLILGDMKNVATLRIRMPISTKDHPRNLINKLLCYKQIIDIPNSVTFMDDLTRCIDWVINGSKTGIYHVVNPEPLTAKKVMEEYQKYVPSHKFEVIDEEQLDKLTTAKRSNCILNSDKLRKEGFQMTNSELALKDCMKQYIKG